MKKELENYYNVRAVEYYDSMAEWLLLEFKLNEGLDYYYENSDEFVVELGKIFNDLVGEISTATMRDVTDGVKGVAYIFARLNILVPNGVFVDSKAFGFFYKTYANPTREFVGKG